MEVVLLAEVVLVVELFNLQLTCLKSWIFDWNCQNEYNSNLGEPKHSAFKTALFTEANKLQPSTSSDAILQKLWRHLVYYAVDKT